MRPWTACGTLSRTQRQSRSTPRSCGGSGTPPRPSRRGFAEWMRPPHGVALPSAARRSGRCRSATCCWKTRVTVLFSPGYPHVSGVVSGAFSYPKNLAVGQCQNGEVGSDRLHRDWIVDGVVADDASDDACCGLRVQPGSVVPGVRRGDPVVGGDAG